jgi:hypothetical protein
VNDLSLQLLSLLLLPRMVQTGREHGTTPRLVVVASEVHYWAEIRKEVLENGNILRTLSSKEYSTPKYVIALNVLHEIDHRGRRIMANRYPLSKRESAMNFHH